MTTFTNADRENLKVQIEDAKNICGWIPDNWKECLDSFTVAEQVLENTFSKDAKALAAIKAGKEWARRLVEECNDDMTRWPTDEDVARVQGYFSELDMTVTVTRDENYLDFTRSDTAWIGEEVPTSKPGASVINFPGYMISSKDNLFEYLWDFCAEGTIPAAG